MNAHTFNLPWRLAHSRMRAGMFSGTVVAGQILLEEQVANLVGRISAGVELGQVVAA